jgi:hypothetical protein
MKVLQILAPLAVLVFIGNYLTFDVARGESFQLKGVRSVIEEDKVVDKTPQELLEIERGRNFVINFLKASFENKYNMTTDKYKEKFKNADTLKRAFNKESYTKIEFIKVELFDAKKSPHMTLKTNLHWFMEGYDGSTTVIFLLVKIKDEWFLDWLIH